MTIGIFTDTYLPDINGVATATKALKEILEKHGNRVVLVTTGLKNQNTISFENDILRIPGVSLKFLYDYRLASFFSSKAYKILKKIPFDVIHVQQEFGISVFGRICASRLRVPLAYTYHTSYEDYSDYFSHGNSFTDRLTKETIKRIVKKIASMKAEIITPSQKARHLLKDYGITRYINVIPNVIDLSDYQKEPDQNRIDKFKKDYNISNRKVFLYLGRIAKEKSIDFTVNTFIKFKKTEEGKSAVLLIVGDGPLEKELKEKVSATEYNSEIIFLGSVPHEDTPFYYSLADFLISASKTETQGLTYLESMSSHLLVIAQYDFNLDGLIEDGETGFFFNDESTMITKMKQAVLLDPETKKRIEENAFVRCTCIYSEDSYYERIMHVYRKAQRALF